MTEAGRSIHSFGEKPVTFALPLPIGQALNDSIERVKEAGGNITRKEIVGAAIFALCTIEARELDKLIEKYRVATTSQLWFGESSNY